MNGHHVLQISFRLLHLGYPSGFGARRPTISVCKSTGSQTRNQKQVEGGHHWDSSKIHCIMEKTTFVIENRINVQNKFSTFHLTTVTGYRSHAVGQLNLLVIKPPLATARAAQCFGAVHLFVCLFVCLSVAKMHKRNFFQKLSNLELWSLLTTYRKSYMGFFKNPLLNP